MKNTISKTSMMAGLLLATAWMASCEKDGDASFSEPEMNQAMELTALQQADEAEWISGEVMDLAEEVYAREELSASGKGIPDSGFIPECVTITTVRTGDMVEKVIDFGAGCETPNGNLISGLIFLNFDRDLEAATKVLTLELADFTFNGIEVGGSATLSRMRANQNGNPQSEVTSSFEARWPEGDTAAWEGNRTREWIEGYGSGFWGDNVFSVTGSQTLVRRNGVTWTRTVLEPLRREWACRFTVSGLLQLERNGQVAELDFGTGDCDAFGQLTYPDGTTETVRLRRLRP